MVLLSTQELTSAHLKNVASVMNFMRQNQDSVDVHLEVDGHKLPAHRLVLCAASTYFRAVFTKRSKEGLADIVQLHGVNLAAVRVVLQYIYTGDLSMDEDVNSIKNVLCAAHIFQLKTLCDHCFRLLCREKILKDSFADLWNLAETYDIEKSETRALVKYVQCNFSKVSCSPQFLRLTKDQLISFLCTPCLNCSTNYIVQTVLLWANHRAEERKYDLVDLLEHLHLHCLSSDYLSELQNHELIRENNNLLALLLKASTKQLQILYSKNDSLSIMYFGEDENGDSCASIYMHGIQMWVKKLMPFTLTLSMAVTYYNKHFYFIGGGNSLVETTDTVLKYCFDTNSVEKVACLGKKKLNVGSAVLGAKLYVVGGLTSAGVLKDVEYYTITSIKWQPVAPTITPHNFPRVVQTLDHLLVVGSKSYSTVELFNPDMNQWSQLSPLPVQSKLHWPCVSVFQNNIYSLHEHNTLYVYSIFKNEWKPVTLPEDLSLWCGIWNNADQSLPFLVVADNKNVFHRYNPSKDDFAKLCEAHDNLQLNWWQTLVISSFQ